MGWLTGWSYRRPVVIDNTNNPNTLTDYQVLVTVDTASLIQQGKMQVDCDDIRFTDSDGSTLLPYWIEGPINAANTKIWVKVPSIPASGTKVIYLYYGNPTAQSESSITDTFIREIDGAQPLRLRVPMDEGSGSTVYDQSGNNFNGTIFGATWTQGKYGNALSFDGVDDYVDFGTAPSLSGTTDFSVVLWLKSTFTGGGFIIAQRAPDYQGEWMVNLGGNHNNSALQPGKIYFMVYNGGFQWEIWSTTAVNNGQWRNIVAVRQGENGYIYIDGNLDAQASGPIKSLNNTLKIAIGRDLFEMDQPLQGVVDEVFLFTRALTSAEILDLYNYYGYATPNYPRRVLVRKRSDPEPTTTVGNEETGVAPPIVIVQRRMLIMSI
jgi:hypothetical protein